MEAAIAAGVSKAAIDALAKRMTGAIDEEAGLLKRMQDDVMFIQEELEAMQSFLSSADGRRIKDSVARTWVRQVRNLSYDTEDLIESVSLLDIEKTPWIASARRVLQSCCCCCCCCPGGPSRLVKAAADMKDLKDRVEGVNQRNMRYNGRLNDAAGSNDMPQPQLRPTSAAFSAPTVSILTEAWRSEKRQADTADISVTKLITEETQAFRVISVWGSGGDVSSIIQESYVNPEICRKFPRRAWLKLAPGTFDPHKIVKSLQDQFEFYSTEHASVLQMLPKWMFQIKQLRYLVILEDLASLGDWHAVRAYLPVDGGNGSRIVVLTEQLEIARLCAGPQCQVVRLRKWSVDHPVCFFFNKDFKRVEADMHPGANRELLVLGAPNQLRRSTDQVIGRDQEFGELCDLVSGPQNARVMSVWGFPGVGKTALLRKVIHAIASRNPAPFHWCPWVDVVVQPFDIGDFCFRMLKINPPPGRASQVHDVSRETAFGFCKDVLKEGQCFLVIDDLQSTKDWDAILSSLITTREFGACNSRTVVVTRDERVAKYCASADNAAFKVKALAPGEALQLFKQEYGSDTHPYPYYMPGETNHILAKCGGIPEVIKAVAGYLRSQHDARQRRGLLEANFMNELLTNPEFASLGDLFSWLHSHVDDLVPQSLMPCILYLSAFPRAGKSIRRSRFVRRWIAEGYYKLSDTRNMKCLGNLFDSVLTRIEGLPECQTNSFFREYIKWKLAEQRLFLGVSTLEGNHDSPTTRHQGEHLAIGSSWKRDESAFQDMEFESQLQSLTVSGQWKPFFISSMSKSLRVLDLEGTWDLLGAELERILKLVPRLRFLSLRGHKGLTLLPHSLFELKHLQTLDIRETYVVDVIKLRKLKNLQYIRAGNKLRWMDIKEDSAAHSVRKFFGRDRGPVIGRNNGLKLPRGIRRLQALQTLGHVNVNTANANYIIRNELGCLKQLRKLQVSGINRQNRRSLCSAILDLENLESLSLRGHMAESSLPQNFRKLEKLSKLFLEVSKQFTQEVITILGSLPTLRTLRLRVKMGQGNHLMFPTPLFIPLQDLEIACRHRLYVQFTQGNVQNLKHLKLYCSRNSPVQFGGLAHPASLKEVLVQGSCDNDLKQALQQQLEVHPNKPALKWKSQPSSCSS